MLEKQLEYIRSKTDFVPEIAVVLGSGLGELADKIDIKCTVDYSELEDFPISTAPSHKGRFVFGEIEGKKVVLMQGRIHLYEGYSSKQITLPIRLMRIMGANKLILTNAAGGINSAFSPGDFMMISDHISCFVDSPLIGKNNDTIGSRFPDMGNAYDKDFQRIVKKVAYDNGIKIHNGVYVQLKGPQFESPAEIKMLSALGADAVGMSTVIETIAAVHCGFKVCGISLITNYACGILDKALSGEEVVETADRVAPDFEKLIKEIIKAI
ncbi:MAG: purine-nucleoside phosphorylase [Eubacterium sp.]|nr:purine-nucleoside phosphorylase [Eubacterium sp.]